MPNQGRQIIWFALKLSVCTRIQEFNYKGTYQVVLYSISLKPLLPKSFRSLLEMLEGEGDALTCILGLPRSGDILEGSA